MGVFSFKSRMENLCSVHNAFDKHDIILHVTVLVKHIQLGKLGTA